MFLFVLLEAMLRCAAGGVLVGASGFNLQDHVLCSDNITALSNVKSEASLQVVEALNEHTELMKKRKDLMYTGGIYGHIFQAHVYHRVVADIATRRVAAGRGETVICETGFNAGHSAVRNH